MSQACCQVCARLISHCKEDVYFKQIQNFHGQIQALFKIFQQGKIQLKYTHSGLFLHNDIHKVGKPFFSVNSCFKYFQALELKFKHVLDLENTTVIVKHFQ